jgi:SNF2 family DNA or RNA helicase
MAAAASPRHALAALESAEAQADEEERQYRSFMHEEALKARREEEQLEAEARRENDAKTAEGAYSSALSVIDRTIERAQEYGTRMLGMHGASLDDAQMGITEQPPTLKGQLRDYQLDGFRWIVRRAFAGESIILADEMGLGAWEGGRGGAQHQQQQRRR